MGKVKYLHRVENLFKRSPVVNFNSIVRIVGSKNYTKQILRLLIKKKKIKRICKSYYSIYEDPSLIVFCYKPSYLGLYDALSFHDLWEQETVPIVITCVKARQGIRKVLGSNVIIKRIKPKYVFGFDYYKNNSFYLPYSDIEKTLIDFFYFKEKLDKEILRKLIKKADKKKLKSYLKVYPKRIRENILSRINNI